MILPQRAPKKIRVPIQVVGGAGTVPVQMTGYIKRISIDPVNPGDTFEWAIIDKDGDGVDGVNSPVTGPQTISNMNDAVVVGMTFGISGASADGQYMVAIHFEDMSR